ncbi:MAG: 4'-phosphopantetheinyl transferase superfamily protein [Armatimonadetes bacterium]|nr:4'-phosphopantetheinyl transferase superfamily protein [Armatimonadota bacterium]
MTATPAWVAAQDPARWLTARERARCDAAPSARRQAERRAGRLAVKRLLLDAFGVAPLAYEVGTDGLAPLLCGWPEVTAISISLSHSAGLGAASWADAGESVGVDAQHIRPAHPGLAARALTAREREQAGRLPSDAGTLLLWALKEAAIKARRRAWGRALREVVVTLDAPGEEAGTAWIEVAGEAEMRAWYGRQGDWWVARAVASHRHGF